MRIKSHHIVLFAIFLIVFSLRVFISVQTGQFSDDNSYFVLRQVENIAQTGVPIYSDNLSYGGRTLLFSPFFYYLLAALYLVFKSTIALKIFLNFFASTLIISTYLVSQEIVKNKKYSLFAAFVSGFIPIYFQQTSNSLSIFSIILPLLFLVIYHLMRLNNDKKYSTKFIISTSFLIVLSPSSIILILGMLFFLLLAKLEKIRVSKVNYEVILVSTFLYLWFNFLLFKRAILFHGPKVIWQNIPKDYILQYFSQINILQTVYLIGIVPFLLGIYAAYFYIVKQKNLNTYMIIGVAFSLFVLLWFRLIPIKMGVIFLGSTLVVMLSVYFKIFFGYVSRTRAEPYSWIMFLGFILVIIATSLVPSVTSANNNLGNTPTNQVIDAYEWISENTDQKATVLASQSEGHALTFFSKRKNVMDNNYLFIKNINQRLHDIKRIYITRFSQEGLELLAKYKIDYIIVTPQAKKTYGIDDLFYSGNECLSQVYNTTVKIYEVTC